MSSEKSWLCQKCQNEAQLFRLADGRKRPYCKRHRPHDARLEAAVSSGERAEVEARERGVAPLLQDNPVLSGKNLAMPCEHKFVQSRMVWDDSELLSAGLYCTRCNELLSNGVTEHLTTSVTATASAGDSVEFFAYRYPPGGTSGTNA